MTTEKDDRVFWGTPLHDGPAPAVLGDAPAGTPSQGGSAPGGKPSQPSAVPAGAPGQGAPRAARPSTPPAAPSGTPSQGLATISASPLQAFRQAGLDLGLGKPFGAPIRLIDRTRVAGTSKVPAIDEVVAGLLPGDRLTLRREPLNAYDRRAVLVLTAGGDKLGYLPVDVNDIPARLMDAGKELYAQLLSVAHRGRYTFVEIEVFLDD